MRKKQEVKNNYLTVSNYYSCAKHSDSSDNSLWDDFISDNAFVCTISDKTSGEFVGYCSIKELNMLDWEISIELLHDWCHKGYGTEALSLFVRRIYELTGNRFFHVRVDTDNYASQALMRKIGAFPNGVSEFVLRGDVLKQFRKDNIDLIDDKMVELSEEFGVEPEDMLGMVLEYRIDAMKMSN